MRKVDFGMNISVEDGVVRSWERGDFVNECILGDGVVKL